MQELRQKKIWKQHLQEKVWREISIHFSQVRQKKKDLSRLQPYSQKQQIMKKNMRNYGSKNLVESVRLMKI